MPRFHDQPSTWPQRAVFAIAFCAAMLLLNSSVFSKPDLSTMKEINYPCKIDQSLQPALFWQATGDEPRPLLVGLHTWSFDHKNSSGYFLELCQKFNWHFIGPCFRGPNWTPEACGSDFVVSDLEDAVAYMKATVKVDDKRVYLMGGSGGGHCSLLLAGRRPDLWTAVSSWCPISDIAAWHDQCIANPKQKGYAMHIEKACGGNPAQEPEARREAIIRSPLSWLANAKGIPVDINTGIHDGHTGSVPVSHAILAFNVLAKPEDRISDEDIRIIVNEERVPEHLQTKEQDPSYGAGHAIYLRRQSGNARLTIFEGGHTILSFPGMTWMGRQTSGQPADWTPGGAPGSVKEKELSR